jgi:hypothetical protein
MRTISDVIADRLRQVGETMFHAQDEFARNRGWQVTASPLGLSRTYRHPGFDRLAQCPHCSGTGRGEQDSCERCTGTGRIVLPSAVPSVRA